MGIFKHFYVYFFLAVLKPLCLNCIFPLLQVAHGLRILSNQNPVRKEEVLFSIIKYIYIYIRV